MEKLLLMVDRNIEGDSIMTYLIQSYHTALNEDRNVKTLFHLSSIYIVAFRKAFLKWRHSVL